MRTGTAALFHSTKMTTSEATATARATFSPPAAVQRSPWHSPVPYLFGGLAAMLGLIAFALLILACSYWKLSSRDEAAEGDVESGAAAEKGEGGSAAKALPVYEEKFLVIMAGDDKPTFLATHMSARTAAFDDEKVDCKDKDKEEDIKLKHEVAEENGEDEEDEEEEESHVSREQIH